MRVSRQGEREDDKFRSPAFQREAIEAFAAREGLALMMYPDEIDESGAKARRPTLETIVAAIEAGELAGVIVARLDRLSRLRPKERIELFERVEGSEGEVLSATESNDVSTPEGRFVRELFLSLARMQWEQKADQFALAKRNAIESRIAIMREAPFGYRFDAMHRLEKVEPEAELVAELFKRRAAGDSLGDVLAYFERVTGRSSYRTTMRYMLANRVYLGELRYGRELELVNVDGAPAIVDAELFEAVEAVNRERAGDRSGAGSGRAKSLLAGIAKCAGCGRGLVRTRTGSKRLYSYKCPQDARHCRARAHVQAEPLEAYVVERVLEWAGPVADELVELEVELDSVGERVVAEHRLADAERRLREWSADVELEERDEQAYRAGVDAREQRVELRRRELEAIGEASELEVARSTVREALQGEQDLSEDERRRLLAVVLEAVVVSRAGRGVAIERRAAVRFATSTSAPELALA